MTMPDSAKLDRYDDLARLVEELHDENMGLRKQRAEHLPWICADKQLPSYLETVLLYMPDDESELVWIGYFDSGDGFWRTVDGMPAGRVTHWMPFPEPPSAN